MIKQFIFDASCNLKAILEAKLREFGVLRHDRIEFLRDVYGNPEKLETGLVDADTEDVFEASVESLKKVWEERENPYNDPPQFFDWFVTHCKREVENTMQ